MLQASGTRKISQPRSKDGKARQAGPMQSDLQRNAVDLYAVDGGGRWRSVAKCPQAPGFQTWPPCLESCSFGALHRWRWAPTNPGSIAAAIEIRRASGVAGTNDCESPGQIAVTGKGWVIGGKEFVPFDEATPSPDGKIWICRRPDHTRRCVFGPPPGSSRDGVAARSDKFQQDFISRPSRASTSRADTSKSPSRATRGAGGSLRKGTAQSRLRKLADTLPAGVAASNAPQTRSGTFRAKSRCMRDEYALGNSRDAIRGASCFGGAAPQQT